MGAQITIRTATATITNTLVIFRISNRECYVFD
jgi:hypothetical protein